MPKTLEAAMAGPFKPTYRSSPSNISPPTSDKFRNIINAYERMLTLPEDINYIQRQRECRDIAHDIAECLDPAEVQTVLNILPAYEKAHKYDEVTSHLSSRLVQNSHNQRIINFSFDFTGIKPFEYFCSFIFSPEKNLEITVSGLVGNYAFHRCQGQFYAQEALGSSFGINVLGKAHVFRKTDPLISTNPAHFTTFCHHGIKLTLGIDKIRDEQYIDCWLYPDGERLIKMVPFYEGYNTGFITPDPFIARKLLASGSQHLIERDKFDNLWKQCLDGLARLDQLFGANP